MSKNRKLLRVVKNFMIATGTWRLEISDKPFNKLAYSVHSVIQQTYYVLFTCSLFYEMVANYTNKKIAEDTPILTMWMTTQVKLLMVQTKRVRKLLVQQNSEEEIILSSENKEIIKNYNKQITTLEVMILSLAFLTLGAAIAMTIVNYITRNSIEVYNRENNASLEKPWLYNSWLPFDKNNHPVLAQTINVYSIYVACSTNTVAQALITGLMLFVKGELLVLQIKLRDMQVMNNEEKSLVECKLEMFQIIRSLATKHQEIIEFVNQLNDALKYLMLLEFAFNCLNAAALCVMIIASVALADAIYESKWYEQCSEAKKMMFIMMMRAQVPLKITIGPIGAMTTQTSLATMKAAYSYVSIMMRYYNNE